MDENTLRIVASNLTAAYYSTNKDDAEKVLDSLTKEMVLPSEIIVRTYKSFITRLVEKEPEIQAQLAKLRESQPKSFQS
jgi:hypothetical protein